MNRPRSITVAAIVTFAYSLYALIWLFIDLVNEGEFVRNGGTFFVALLLIFFSMGVVAAYGVWHNQRWGKILAIVVLTFNGLLALPGILFGSTLALKAEAFVGVAVAILVALLLLGAPAAGQSDNTGFSDKLKRQDDSCNRQHSTRPPSSSTH